MNSLKPYKNILILRRFSPMRPFGNKRKRWAVNQSSNEENLPDFQSLLRSVYKKTHPDLLRASFPNEAITNDESMQVIIWNPILLT